MEKARIGAVLKRRIKEKGYTQEKFAEEVGVKYSTLKKYLSGKSAYSYELLLLFADKLNCSVDYLLDLSKSPIKEHHEIAEQTRLSEEAIEKLCKYASFYDEEFDAQRYIDLLDMMICEDGVMNAIFDYLIASRLVDGLYKDLVTVMNWGITQLPVVQKMDVSNDFSLNLEEVQLIHLMSTLKEFKRNISQLWVDRIKRLDSYAEYLQQIENINKNLATGNID